MAVRAWWQRRRSMASTAVVSMAAVSLTVLAVIDEGITTTDVELHDGGVWLTNESLLMAGHLNRQALALDGSYRTSTGFFDVYQHGNVIGVHDLANSTLAMVDAATLTAPTLVAMPGDSQVGIGGGTGAILDPEDGRLWVMRDSALAAADLEALVPLAEVGPDAVLAVGRDGTVAAVSAATGTLVTARPEGPTATVLSTTELDLGDDAVLDVTLVGDRPVVHDAIGTVIYAGAEVIEVPPGAVLQQPTPQATTVVLATEDAWWVQPLDGSEAVVTEVGSPGTPAAPVVVAGCIYLAWAGNGEYRRDCLDDAFDVAAPIDGALSTASFVFRVNRDVVVLNDVFNGTSWLSSEGMERIDNWDALLPPNNDDDDVEYEEEDELQSLPERDEVNTPPVAEDDRFGVRAGQTTVIPVVDNDYDLDGDLLTAVAVDVSAVPGDIQPIRDGEAFQVVLPPEASGSASFTYRIADGRGGIDDATVSLTIAPEGSNTAPETRRRSRVQVESGASIFYNVLPDWMDPEGDTIFLRSAVAPAPHGVQFSPDGQMTITAADDFTGTFEVDVVVSDGIDDGAGTIQVDVWPAETLPPQTNSDHVVTSVDRPVTISPLGNDISRSGLPLRLARVDEMLGFSLVPDYANNTFTFASDAAGTFYVQYLVTDSITSSAGLIRIDVLPEVDATLPPIAVADTALVAPARETLVDVLANDSDPGGRVLVIQNVEVPERSGLQVSILEHRLLRITDTTGITEPVALSYLVSNGTDTARATVTVLPVDPPSVALPPDAEDDTVEVRVGDVATVAVLDNDTHPQGDVLTLAGLAEPLVDPAMAQVFVSGNEVRILAGTTPGTVTATYDVVDESAQRDSAQVRIRIVGFEGDNVAPRPRDTTARVLAGNTVRIPIELQGIDPDGDSVSLEGLASSPELGRVVQQGEDWIVYEAYADSQGTDTFEYEVRDQLGATARGSIVVGVAPVRGFNNAPVAMRDEASTRAGYSVSVAVLDNDVDPDSDAVTLLPELEAPEGVQAEVRGDRVYITAPEEGQYTVQYTIEDVFGAQAAGTVFVTVDDALEPVAPIARDDRILPEDVDDDGIVEVEVLVNDEDPDGTTAALEVAVSEAEALVSESGVVTLQVRETARIVSYTITDRDGLSSTAFIMVPGMGTSRPQLVTGATLIVDSGETAQLALDDYITTSNGNPPLVTQAESVRVAHGNGNPLVIDENTLEYTSAEGYWGKDAITVEVTDGLSVDDPAGRLATITIPITVLPTGNAAPTFRDARIEVTPGEDPTALDLARLASDDNDDDILEFAVTTGIEDGFTATIEGSVLSVAATADVAKGTIVDLTVEVTDGIAPPVEGVVRVVVTTSSRALAVANDDYVEDARPGELQVVDVLANDSNPFPGEPLTVVQADLEAGNAAVSVVDNTLHVTPVDGFHGTVQIAYTIEDFTGDPDRHVEGRAYVTVVKEPDAPSKPQLRTVEDRMVVLEWTAPANNGAPIEEYIVRSDQGTEDRCTTTICTIDGLTNDVEYRFTVTAVNRAGESAPSSPSDVARPDVRPDQPAPPELTFGDESLTVNWQTPNSEGSPVSSYTLEIVPAPLAGPGQISNVTATSFEWTGLENGTAYQVRVQAHNDAVEPSAWSELSATEVPAGPPVTPAKPTTTRLAPVGNRAQIGVQWTEPSGNGDTVSEYTVTAWRGGTATTSVRVPAGQLSTAFELDTSETSYTFTVVATNKAGDSQASAPSDPRRAFVAPGAPTAVSATPGDGNLTVAFTPGPRNGADAAWITYEYQLNGGGAWQPMPGNRVIGGLSNGSSYTVKVRATVTADGVSYTGSASAASAAVVPYGVPPRPTVTSTNNNGTARFTWSAATENGRPITSLQYRLDGGSWQSGSISGGSVNAPSAGGTHTIDVRVQDSEGQWSPTASRSQTINPVIRVWRGPSYNQGACAGSPDCYLLNYELLYFPPNTTMVRECMNSDGKWHTSNLTVTTNSSGSASNEWRCYISSESRNPWSGPYWTRVRLPDGTWVNSNRDVSW